MRLLSRLTFALALACIGAGANAAHAVEPQQQALPNNVHVGVGVICDSSEQVERYLALKNDRTSVEDAIKTVNTEANQASACGMAMVAFTADDPIAKVSVQDGTMHVTKITVLAIATDHGWQRIHGTVQYTAFLEKLESV
jgi:hypothetical protein